MPFALHTLLVFILVLNVEEDTIFYINLAGELLNGSFARIGTSLGVSAALLKSVNWIPRRHRRVANSPHLNFFSTPWSNGWAYVLAEKLREPEHLRGHRFVPGGPHSLSGHVPGGTNLLADVFPRNKSAAEQFRYDTGHKRKISDSGILESQDRLHACTSSVYYAGSFILLPPKPRYEVASYPGVRGRGEGKERLVHTVCACA